MTLDGHNHYLGPYGSPESHELPARLLATWRAGKANGSPKESEPKPKKLKLVRQHMIDAGLSRCVINRRIERIKRAFKWAVADELRIVLWPRT